MNLPTYLCTNTEIISKIAIPVGEEGGGGEGERGGGREKVREGGRKDGRGGEGEKGEGSGT